MKRFISTFVAAMMLVASMATTALAVDYNLTLSAVDTEGNAVTEVKKGDVIIVNATMSAISGTAGLNFSIGVDPAVFALKNDPATEADEEFIAVWDDTNNCAAAPCVPYSFYRNWASIAANSKWGTMVNEVPSSLTNGLKTVGFGFMNGSNLRTNATNVLVGAVQLEVIADVTTDTAATISIVNPTVKALTSDLAFTTLTDATVTIKADAPATANVTVGAIENAIVTVSTEGEVAIGDVITVSAKPMAGYEITAANDDALLGMGGEVEITVTGDIEIAVTAAKDDAKPAIVAAAFADEYTVTFFAKAPEAAVEYGIDMGTDIGIGSKLAAKSKSAAGFYGIKIHNLPEGSYNVSAYADGVNSAAYAYTK